MNVAEYIDEVRAAVTGARRAGRTVGFVPTMGALHEGHYSLIDAARADGGLVAVSIFVNPTQFGPGEDLAGYPRPIEADLAGCRQRGVDLVFAPSAETMYGRGGHTQVIVPELSDTLCGRSRPGHFAGVCTVVAKLFNIVQPDRAYFGLKDFQQVAVLRRMTGDLNFPVEIVACPTVREADGLAMSSRNAYLSAEHRRQAAALYRALTMASLLIAAESPPAGQVAEAIRRFLAAEAPDGEIDYVQLVDPDSLADVETTDRPLVIALAVRLGRARLIDNMLVDAAGAGPVE